MDLSRRSMLELRALGNAEIATEKATLTPAQEIVFASALYLLLERGKHISRSSFAELLWPTVDVSVRAHRLRQTLLQLKKLGFPVVADRNNVRISTDQISGDIDPGQFTETVRFHADQSLVFLPGYSPRFSEQFRDWVDGKRSQFNASYSRGLVEILGRERVRANWKRVETTARAVLELDPYNESAVLALAESSAMRGQKHEAVRMIDEYLRDVGGNPDIRLPASLLRKRILDTTAAPAPTSIPDPAFVGRQAELEKLSFSLKEAHKGRGGACLMVGEPGIGKSRLAAELAKFATLQGIRTITVRCQRPNVDRPLAVLVDLVPGLRELPGAIGCSQETLVALRRLTELDTRGAEVSVSSAESHALHRTIRIALFDLLDAITEEVTLLLVFEDTQWIDRISADILAEIIAWSKRKRLLLVLNSRKRDTEPANVFAIPSTEVVDLRALTGDDAELLLASIVRERVSDHTGRQYRWILEVGEGNPFFLQELAKHWIESGGHVDAPSSVNDVLKDRLAKLGPVSMKVLQACTVLGQSSTVERVERVLEYSSHELLGAIQELSRLGMLASSDSGEITPLALRTRHDLLSSAVLEGLDPAPRAFLHWRAGLVLEQEMLGDRISTSGLWACVFHWQHAGNRERALSVVRSYSQHLLEVGLPNDASQALDCALQYCSTDDERMSLLARQGEVLQMAGKWERSKEVLHACRELRSRITRSCDQHDALELMLFDASRRTSLSVLEVLQDILVCVRCQEATAEHRIQAAVIALKLATDFDQDILDSVFRDIEPLFAETRNDMGRIEAEMIYHTIRGDREKGLDAARTLVQLARESRDPARLVTALVNAGNSYRINGTDPEAEEYLREAISCALRHHLMERAKVAMQCVVNLRLSMGEIGSAREMLDRSNTLPLPPENLASATEQHVLEARVALEEGQVALAERAFSIVRDQLFTSVGSRKVSALALSVRLQVLGKASPQVLRETVYDLEAHQMRLQSLGVRDFEMESLFVGLAAIGEESRGRQIIRDYLREHRRDIRPASPGLAAVAASCT